MNRLRPTLILLLAGTLSSTACKSQLDGKQAAKVQEAPAAPAKPAEPAKPAAPAEPAAAAGKLALIGAKSSVGFVGAKVTGDHTGGFSEIHGDAAVQGGALNTLAMKIKTASVTSDAEKLTAHLKSPDFFDVAKFPESTFESSKITAKAGPEGSTHEIQGTLTLHGVKKLITFPAKVQATDKHVSTQAQFKINRKDFGIVYPGRKDDLIKDDVLLKIDLHFGA